MKYSYVRGKTIRLSRRGKGLFKVSTLLITSIETSSGILRKEFRQVNPYLDALFLKLPSSTTTCS